MINLVKNISNNNNAKKIKNASSIIVMIPMIGNLTLLCYSYYGLRVFSGIGKKDWCRIIQINSKTWINFSKILKDNEMQLNIFINNHCYNYHKNYLVNMQTVLLILLLIHFTVLIISLKLPY